jgi:hypothetical protein
MDNFSFLTNVFPSVDIFIGFKPALKRNTKGNLEELLLGMK